MHPLVPDCITSDRSCLLIVLPSRFEKKLVRLLQLARLHIDACGSLSAAPRCVPGAACNTRAAAVCRMPCLFMQAKFAALSTSAKQWTDQTGTTLRNAAAGHFGGSTDSPTASSTLKEIARSKSGALPASAAQESGKENQAAAKQKDAGLGHDQELEAYLHVSSRLPVCALRSARRQFGQNIAPLPDNSPYCQADIAGLHHILCMHTSPKICRKGTA